MSVYNAEVDYDLAEIDLLSLIFDSPEVMATDDTILHAEAAHPDNNLTKAQMRRLTRRVAHILRHVYGIGASGPGKDVVVCISSGQVLLPAVFYGTIAAGGVYSAASSALTVTELLRQIRDGGAALLVASTDCCDVAYRAAEQAGLPKDRVLLIESTGGKKMLPSHQAVDLLAEAVDELSWERIRDPRELSSRTICLVYSSGTTGYPKGVKITHKGLVSYALVVRYAFRDWQARQRAKDPSHSFEYRTLAHVPAAHIAGIQGFFVHPVVHGGTVYWMPKFDFAKFLEMNASLRITTFFSVPPIYLAIAHSPLVENQFASLHHALSGAAPMSAELTMRVEAKLGCPVMQVYGLSETTGAVTMQPWDEVTDKAGISALQPNTKVRLLDDEERDVLDGSPGELVVQSDGVTTGYWNNPQATAEAFTRCGRWFKTGDVAVRRDKKFYLVDRKKELIKYKGLQVAPAEIEAHLLSHPNIKDAAVIGVADPQSAENEVPRAYIVADASQISAADVKSWVKSSLASHKQLRGGVIFLEAIPKSATGKILRRQLRDLAVRENSFAVKL